MAAILENIVTLKSGGIISVCGIKDTLEAFHLCYYLHLITLYDKYYVVCVMYSFYIMCIAFLKS